MQLPEREHQQEQDEAQPTRDHHAHVVVHATPRYQCHGSVHNDSDMPRPRYHAALSLAVATVVVARTRRWRDALPVLVAGVLVDVDDVEPGRWHHHHETLARAALEAHWRRTIDG